jgi:hypothetical protein
MGAEDFRRNFQTGDIDALVADFAPGFRVFHAGQEDSTTDPDFSRIMFRAIRALFGDQFQFSDCVWRCRPTGSGTTSCPGRR